MLLGCCSEAKAFLKRIGSLRHVEFHDRVNLIAPNFAATGFRRCEGRDRLTIKSSPLPAPLHLLPSIAATPYLSRSQKANLAQMLGWMLLNKTQECADGPRPAESARSYLKSLGCSEALLDRLLDPVIVSALNETAEEASAKYARMVMVESLVKGRGSYRLGEPRVPQSELIADAAMKWLGDRGCEVRLSSRVRNVRISDGRARSVELASGEVIEADAFVTAVPPAALKKMGMDPGDADLLRWRPIISAHLFYESPTPPFEPACVVGEPFGWVFSRHTDLGYVEAVASAAEGISHLDKGQLLSMACRAAAVVEPMLDQIPLRRGIVYRAHEATFATLGCDAYRPRAVGSTANLFVAGDWTATGWPATIEGAVRSGLAAAREVLRVT